MRAVRICDDEFKIAMQIATSVWYPAYIQVWSAIETTLLNSPDTQILELPANLPFQDILFDYESSVKPTPFKFAIYHDSNRDLWTYTAINIHPGTFRIRCNMPASWCGKRDSELCQITQIPECIFIHHTGFKGANRTYKGILSMVNSALRAV
uniref:Uncharacterized protein n=1 Tax=Lygus hesperus TaxID=30085 RepID=A0A0A9WND6_LYGHE